MPLTNIIGKWNNIVNLITEHYVLFKYIPTKINYFHDGF